MCYLCYLLSVQSAKAWLVQLTHNSSLASSCLPPGLLGPLLDFASSCLSTFVCSVVSTPQVRKLTTVT